MATEFVAFQPPPGDALSAYDRTQPHDAQPSTVPQTFREAMEVRDEVFVQEQKVPLENELDEDDPRSFHWVVYASVGNTAAPSPSALRPVDARVAAGDERRRSGSTATRVPVGTIRLVPPPHKSHAEHMGHDGVDANNGPLVDHVKDAESTDSPDEPFVKLGRLAVLKPYRRLGLSKLLINAALNWAKEHTNDIVPPLAPADVEAARLDGKTEVLPWKGLILVHAQTQVQRLWESAGFVKDESMGAWMEEGIEHIGLWKRVEVKSEGWKATLATPGLLDLDRKVA
jgi:predicted GNAT family N-acyltransferase